MNKFIFIVIIILGFILSQEFTIVYAHDILTACTSLESSNPTIYFQYDDPNEHPENVNYMDVVKIPFNDFIIGVVEGEIFPGAGDDQDGIAAFHTENLKAQAIAIRSFTFSNCSMISGFQVKGLKFAQTAYYPNRSGSNYEPLIGTFVRNNSYYLANNNVLTNAIDAQFKDFTHSPTTFYTQAEVGEPNLFAVYDAVMQQSAYGGAAGSGYSQNGGGTGHAGGATVIRNVIPNGIIRKSLPIIIQIPNCGDFNGIGYWGAYRWNMLQLTPANDTFYVNEGKAMTMRIQNTGSNPWLAGTRLYVRWRREPRNGGSPTVSGWIDVAAVSAHLRQSIHCGLGPLIWLETLNHPRRPVKLPLPPEPAPPGCIKSSSPCFNTISLHPATAAYNCSSPLAAACTLSGSQGPLLRS